MAAPDAVDGAVHCIINGLAGSTITRRSPARDRVFADYRCAGLRADLFKPQDDLSPFWPRFLGVERTGCKLADIARLVGS